MVCFMQLPLCTLVYPKFGRSKSRGHITGEVIEDKRMIYMAGDDHRSLSRLVIV